ncbi:MAG: hypothetical protein ABIB97_00695 [Patescibacteria group bacterium]
MAKNNTSKNKSSGKPGKKEIHNAMFYQSSHYYLAILTVIALTFIMIVYLDDIKETSQQLNIVAEEIAQINLSSDYQEVVVDIVDDYFMERQNLDASSSVTEIVLGQRSDLIEEALDQLVLLKVTEEDKDFHLKLLLAFNQIKDSENTYSQSIQYSNGLAGKTIDLEMADQLLASSKESYQAATASVDLLQQQNTWFSY